MQGGSLRQSPKQLCRYCSSLCLLWLLIRPAAAYFLEPTLRKSHAEWELGTQQKMLEEGRSNLAQGWVSEQQNGAAASLPKPIGGKSRKAVGKWRDRRLGLRVRLKRQGADPENRPGPPSSTLVKKPAKSSVSNSPPPPPGPLMLTPEQIHSIRQPISIALLTPHFFGSEYAHDLDSCDLEGLPLWCSYKERGRRLDDDFHALIAEADALWYHAPSSCMLEGGPWNRSDGSISPFKHHAGQLAVIMSMESSAYYKCLDDSSFLDQFDIEMTYRKTSDVPLFYWGDGYRQTWEAHPPLQQAKKKDAVVFINSNCGAPSGRTDIVQALMGQPGITVDSFGKCLNNQEEELPMGAGKKYDTFRNYKYCIAIENSIAEDYVTEKVYDALAAGCVPIYLGAPNIADFIPSRNAIIDYNDFGSAEALAEELRRLSADEEAYEAMFAWRADPESWEPFFKQMSVPKWSDGVHSQCRLCQIVARRRAGLPDPSSAKLKVTEGRPKNTTRPYRPAGLIAFDKIKRVDYVFQMQPQTVEDVTRR